MGGRNATAAHMCQRGECDCPAPSLRLARVVRDSCVRGTLCRERWVSVGACPRLAFGREGEPPGFLLHERPACWTRVAGVQDDAFGVLAALPCGRGPGCEEGGVCPSTLPPKRGGAPSPFAAAVTLFGAARLLARFPPLLLLSCPLPLPLYFFCSTQSALRCACPRPVCRVYHHHDPRPVCCPLVRLPRPPRSLSLCPLLRVRCCAHVVVPPPQSHLEAGSIPGRARVSAWLL